LTFRAAGTSLSGQAVTDGVLVDVSRHWRALEVLDGGARVASARVSSAGSSTRTSRGTARSWGRIRPRSAPA
jgi:D-lactate dehydrogenase